MIHTVGHYESLANDKYETKCCIMHGWISVVLLGEDSLFGIKRLYEGWGMNCYQNRVIHEMGINRLPANMEGRSEGMC